MIGKSPLWAAWTEGAPESELVVIREAMDLDDQPLPKKKSHRTTAAREVAQK